MNFNQVALDWDNSPVRVERAKIVSKNIINNINIKKDFKALEFGCGTGLLSFNLREFFKEINLIDSSKGMIDVLKNKIEKNKINNMNPIELKLTSSKQINNRFNVIYTLMVLHHIKDYSHILGIFYDILLENGYLCIADLVEEDGSYHKNEIDFFGHNGFNQLDLINKLNSIGFKNIKSSIIFNNKKEIEGIERYFPVFLMIANK